MDCENVLKLHLPACIYLTEHFTTLQEFLSGFDVLV